MVTIIKLSITGKVLKIKKNCRLVKHVHSLYERYVCIFVHLIHSLLKFAIKVW